MGVLNGYKIVEFAGIGPAPFCAMVLSDMGAEVLRVDRVAHVPASAAERPGPNILNRGRRSVALDLKQPQAVEAALKLIDSADALIEGFRPQVMERLGLGPEVCLQRNAGLIYGRMTGWGQDGPMALDAGHDINYIALAGCLAHLGRNDGTPPIHPLNLIGDFGGGGMLMALGVLGALLEREKSGKGQVVDAAMVDGTAMLMSMLWGWRHTGAFSAERGTNMNDTGSHFYNSYKTKDGGFITIGAIEPQFYANLLRLTGLEGQPLPKQLDHASWSAMKDKLAEVFLQKTRDEWCAVMAGTDVCFAPVLTMDEALQHPHIAARDTYIEVAGVQQPAPAPRFSRTPSAVQSPGAYPGEHTDAALADWGVSAEELRALRAAKAIA